MDVGLVARVITRFFAQSGAANVPATRQYAATMSPSTNGPTSTRYVIPLNRLLIAGIHPRTVLASQMSSGGVIASAVK